MVGTNEAVCYSVSIVNITLPNKPLLTGSIIAFYPFVYVQLENVTSPVRVSTNTIRQATKQCSQCMCHRSAVQTNSTL